jgi:hypothetical protein
MEIFWIFFGFGQKNKKPYESVCMLSKSKIKIPIKVDKIRQIIPDFIDKESSFGGLGIHMF